MVSGCMDWYLEDRIDLQKNLCTILCHLAEIVREDYVQ